MALGVSLVAQVLVEGFTTFSIIDFTGGAHVVPLSDLCGANSFYGSLVNKPLEFLLGHLDALDVTLTVGRRVRTRIGLLSDDSSESTEAERGLALTERQGFLRRSR
ncbi:uncharacterized protein F5147DRAFT_770590 [Suillus discolor]|uniref:Uncharacterized protein n=1 Tax=Suillus discolor TaxID=1912936 RepID=A0A9P7FCC4_9AGAM|nr:uncharacterized protein F5147DRAFT_770590 [Suillus discolor]KAG2113947.1 hypothetical protein F5147DRAFT_770590 [Suillus discolor]